MATLNHSPMRRFLARLLLRSRLSREEQEAILDLPGRLVHVRPQTDIVSPGEKVDHACLVDSGLAARFDQMANGQRQITCLHIPGDMCDLHSVPSSVSGWAIQALAASRFIRVPHSALRALVAKYPAIALAFWRDTTVDGSILAKWVGNLGRRNAHERLAHLVCEMGVRMEYAGLGRRTEFALQATQTQLADALGITAVHVNRSLQALRRDGFVRTEHRIVYVDDWDRLASLAQFDPDFLLLPGEMGSAGAGTQPVRASCP